MVKSVGGKRPNGLSGETGNSPKRTKAAATASGTPTASTMKLYGDKVTLMECLEEEDFKNPRSYLSLSLTDLRNVRKQREENSDF